MKTPNKLELDGHVYVIGALDAFKQLHVARKVAPVITSLGMTIASLSQKSAEETVDMGLQMMGPAMEVVAHMEEADVNYVVHTCLSAVTRIQGEDQRPARVINGSNLMFQDIQLMQLIRLTVEVIRENLSDFFPLLNAVTTSQASSEAP